MKEFRFAIMGAGHIARNFCDAAALVPNCRVAAVASKSLDRAKALSSEKGIPAAFDSYEDMLASQRPDCVYIATTCDSHYDLAMLCTQYGMPVLCEKAMFTTFREADDFFRFAREKGVFAMEALWSRFLPAVNMARQWLKEGRIGKAALAEMNIGFVAPPDPENRYFSPRLGGGASNDLTVYGLQILMYALNRTISEAHAVAVPAETGVDATSIVLLDMQGLPASVKSSFCASLNEGLMIYGDKGRIVVPHAHYASEAILYGQNGEETARFRDETTQNGFTYEIEEVMNCIARGALESDVVPQESTLSCAKIFDQIRASMKR